VNRREPSPAARRHSARRRPTSHGLRSPVIGAIGRQPTGRLGDLLARASIVPPEVIADALLRQDASGKRLGTLLVENGDLDPRQLAEVLAHQSGLPVIDLGESEPALSAVAALSEDIARRLNAIPLRIDGNKLHIAVTDGLPMTYESIAQNSGYEVRMYVAPERDISQAIDIAYSRITPPSAGLDDVDELADPTNDAPTSDDFGIEPLPPHANANLLDADSAGKVTASANGIETGETDGDAGAGVAELADLTEVDSTGTGHDTISEVPGSQGATSDAPTPSGAALPVSDPPSDATGPSLAQLLADAHAQGATMLLLDVFADSARATMMGDTDPGPLTLGRDEGESIVAELQEALATEASSSDHFAPRQTTIATPAGDLVVDAALLVTRAGASATLRWITAADAIPQLDDLGLAADQLALLRAELTASRGLIIITGPDGTDPSSALLATVTELDRDRRRVFVLAPAGAYTVARTHHLEVSPDSTVAQHLARLEHQAADVIALHDLDAALASDSLREAAARHLVIASIVAADVGEARRLVAGPEAPIGLVRTVMQLPPADQGAAT